MRYEGNVYRPPSEAHSLIVQTTIGCAHGKCRFCSMYKADNFRVRPLDEVLEDFRMAREAYRSVGRVFLADGDAMVLGTDTLLTILGEISALFPECERVSIYGTPRDALRKTPEELRALAEAGLAIVYIGAESGDDEVLRRVEKGATADEIIEAIRKLEEAELAASVTFISGLGGAELSEQHALGCARVITESRPSFAALLTLLLDPVAPMYKDLQAGTFEFMTPEEIAEETLLLLEHARPKTDCVFRSNHASNYVPLKGTLPHDNEQLIETLRKALASGAFKSDHFRAL
ncbi:MAG: radical SAM protein [Clostridiales bacterium]|nr:radical SAM protein [Clostridiales bacterium]